MVLADMCNYKILDNIEPYNDIYYKNCFYQAFFPVVNHFNKDIALFLLNDIFVYDYDKEKDGLRFDLKALSIESESKLMEEIGIVLQAKKSSSIISDLKTSINSERPVIIPIDAYYESFRPGVYLGSHTPHNLLVYGYNEYEQTFNILEQISKDSLRCGKNTISYMDTDNCYNGYLNNFLNDNKLPTYYEFYLDQSNPVSNHKDYYDINKYILIFVNSIFEKKRNYT